MCTYLFIKYKHGLLYSYITNVRYALNRHLNRAEDEISINAK